MAHFVWETDILELMTKKQKGRQKVLPRKSIFLGNCQGKLQFSGNFSENI